MVNIEEQLPDSDQSPDQSGEGFFFNVDFLDELMGSLAAVYTRLLLFEKNKPVPDTGLIEKYTGRHDEILLLKESIPINAAGKRNKATRIYTQELSQARLLLEDLY